MVLQIETGPDICQRPLQQSTASFESVFDLPLQGQIETIKSFGAANVDFLLPRIFFRSYLPRTVFRHDRDVSFQGNTWLRDYMEVAADAIDPYVRNINPEQIKALEWLCAETLKRQFEVYGKDEEWVRFDQRPQEIGNGYQQRMVPDDLAPTTKFSLKGERVNHGWSHNQLDALSKFQSVSVNAIRLGLDILQQTPRQKRPPGEIILKTAAYLSANMDEDIATHMLWEAEHAFSSDDTKMEIVDAQKSLLRIFSILEKDASDKGYKMHITRPELIEAIYTGSKHQTKYTPYDYTAPFGHPNPEDLGQLKAIVDTNPPLPMQLEILEYTKKLEGEYGFVRWIGDPWKRNKKTGEHAQWGFGNEYMAMIDADIAMRYHQMGETQTAKIYLQHGMQMIDRTRETVYRFKYPRELHYRRRDGQFLPNRNDLAWRRVLIHRACSRMVTALKTIRGDNI